MSYKRTLLMGALAVAVAISGALPLGPQFSQAAIEQAIQSAAETTVTEEARDMVTDPKIMPVPEMFKYEYVGEALPSLPAQHTVYKKSVSQSVANLGDVLSRLNVQGVDISKFQGLQVQNITLAEDREYGYAINIDAQNGTVGISQNWQRWPQVGLDCRDEACWESLRIKQSDLPSDEQAISIANSFLTERGIQTSQYGQPVVQNYWRTMFEKTEDKTSFYFPEMVSVVYPLLVNGQEVLDESGNPHGMNVGIDVRSKRVANVWPIHLSSLVEENVAGETDANKILELAENGDFRYITPPMPLAENVTTTTLQLGTPEIKMVNMWTGDGKGSASEIIMPSLVFPILTESEQYYRTSVVIPLVKSELDKINTQIVPQG